MSPSRQQNRRQKAKISPLGDEVDDVEYAGHASLAIAAGLLPIPADVRRRVRERVCLTASEREEVAMAAVHMQHIHDAVDVTALNKMMTKLTAEVRVKADRMAKELRGYVMGGDVKCEACDGGVKGGLACQCGRTWYAAAAPSRVFRGRTLASSHAQLCSPVTRESLGFSARGASTQTYRSLRQTKA